MNRFFRLLVICVLLGVSTIPASAQGDSTATISLIDHDGQVATALVDGNQVKLVLKLSSPVSTTSAVAFFLEDSAQPVANCTLAAGSDTCTSDLVTTLGWFWGTDRIPHPTRKIKGSLGGQPLPGALEVTIRPRPVVMLHGFNSNWETWQTYLGPQGYLAQNGLQGFAVGDGQAPGVFNTGNLANPNVRTNTIAQNAAVLAGYIAGVQKQTGAEKVDLLVHSMGGLITRYYLDRVMNNDNVAQVIFLGTPMAGSECTYPLVAAGFLMPASLEILPDYMVNVFNRQITHRHGVRFSALAGTLLVDLLTSPCASVPSDVVVGLDSVTSVPVDLLKQMPDYHGDMTSDSKIFDTFVSPLLKSPPGDFTPRPDPQTPAGLTAVSQFSRGYSGHINRGDSTQVTIEIDPNVSLANFSLFDSSHSLETEVRGASGKVINLDPAVNGVLKIDQPEALLYLGYGFKQPKPGKWVIRLMTTDKTPATGADYSLVARYTGGASLEAHSSLTIPAAGERVTLSAHLANAGPGTQVDSVEAVIHKPDGSQVNLPLGLQGGDYSAEYSPDQSGLYSAQVVLTGKTSDGFGIDRAAFLAFEVQPSGQPVGPYWLSALGGLVLWVVLFCVFLAGLALLYLFYRQRQRK